MLVKALETRHRIRDSLLSIVYKALSVFDTIMNSWRTANLSFHHKKGLLTFGFCRKTELEFSKPNCGEKKKNEFLRRNLQGIVAEMS